ncbi:MAG: hypothetical protein HY567_01970 [Candidatus Kerfeldbacteria bacterium]|nr:hypothetical protein [Candidatus Kerfeldbacteria bacterium]
MEQRFSSETERQPGAPDSGESLERAAQRKRLFTVLAAIGGAALVLGVVGLVNTITSPFPRPTVPNTNGQERVLEELKQQDTDGDGLKDYDEVFTYRTSAFVRDSDSDGLSDGDEVAARADPNCPPGQSCGAVAVTNVNINGVISNPTASALRKALKQAGAPAYIIDQTDDQTLLEQYRGVLVGTNANVSLKQSDLTNLSAAQIRELLRSNGVADDASLAQIDDETLIAIYQDALSN